MKLIPSATACIFVTLIGLAPGQNFAPPPSKKPPQATLKAIKEKRDRLAKVITQLSKQGIRDPYLADVEVYLQAVSWAVDLDEFFQPQSGDWTLEALDRGLVRASLVSQANSPWYHSAGFPVIRGYRSSIDGSLQPYAVTYPAAYGKDPTRKWRLDVVLHGRDTSLNEVKFLHRFNGDEAAPKDQDFVRIDIFGRGNNAYRWAGEIDVFEAVDHFLNLERILNRGGLVDLDRMVLRGFSMGGAGTWHIGLHRPDRWCLIGPGAGFTTTHGYIAKLPPQLPAYQEACLRIYDAQDYAENAANVPVVAYSGSKDPQRLAADIIEKRLKSLGIPMTHLVAPGLGHKFPPEWQKKAEAIYAKHVAKGKVEYPQRVRFVTYTMRYPTCSWVEILGLEKHYQQARVEAEHTETGFTVKTQNIRTLKLTLRPGTPAEVSLKIDGQEFNARAWMTSPGVYHLYLDRAGSKWKWTMPQRIVTDWARRPHKTHGLQGPIDDAFTASFLCVRGTGKPWHQAAGDYTGGVLAQFEKEWARFWRGQLPVKDDTDVTNEDIAGKHLILFGDPASNTLIGQVLDALPLKWTKDEIVLAGKKYPAATHVPVLIYPNPLNLERYVVLNSGHTFHAADYRGTNALLYPRLGDYAVLTLAATDRDPLGTSVAGAGLFDEYWKP